MKLKFNKWNNVLCISFTQRRNVILMERYVDNNCTVEKKKCNLNCLDIFILHANVSLGQ